MPVFSVPAAAQYCEAAPDDPRCAPDPVQPAQLSIGQHQSLAQIARRIRLRADRMASGNSRYRADDPRADVWTPAGPDTRGDCEDRLLWAAQELRRLHPELARSYRFVAVEDAPRRGQWQSSHLVMVVEGSGGRVVLDTDHGSPRSWNDYRGRRAWTAQSGMGGQWTDYE